LNETLRERDFAHGGLSFYSQTPRDALLNTPCDFLFKPQSILPHDDQMEKSK